MIIIGPGITIGGGIGVDGGVGASPGGGGGGSMRALLSASGQAAYDSAATDNFFAVSQADYDAVAAGLSSVTKYAMSEIGRAHV